jgi:hypothetical protein
MGSGLGFLRVLVFGVGSGHTHSLYAFFLQLCYHLAIILLYEQPLDVLARSYVVERCFPHRHMSQEAFSVVLIRPAARLRENNS